MGRKKRRGSKRKVGCIRQAVVLLPVIFLLVMLSQTVFAKTEGVGERERRVTCSTFATEGRMTQKESLQEAESRRDPDPVTVVRQEVYTATVSHEVVYCNDASIPAGTEEILIPGRDGEVLRTADVTYVNGEEVLRRVTAETMTISPVTEIIGVGTGEAVTGPDMDAMPVIGDGYIILPTGEVLTYTDSVTIRATAYTHTDAGCDMITATGSTVHVGTVAVDPRYIPYGTRMFIVSNDGCYVYGVAEAEDCGGAIKGDRMDLYFPTYDECMQFGWRVCTVYLLGQE